MDPDQYAGAVVHRDEDRHLALPEGGGGGGVGAPHHIQRLGADGPRCGGGAAGAAAADGRVGKPTALDGYEGAVESVQRVLGDAFASACGFEVDACRPGRGSDRGKVERGVRGFRESKSGVFREGAGSLGELEERLAARGEELMARWICPATGESVAGCAGGGTAVAAFVADDGGVERPPRARRRDLVPRGSASDGRRR